MKRIVFLAPLFFAMACSTSKKVAEAPPPPPAPVMSTAADSASYAIGVQVATYYKNQGMDSVNFYFLGKAYEDVYKDSPLIFDLEHSNMILQKKLQEFQAKKLKKEKAQSQTFLDSNSKRPGVITLPSGLQYEIITKGTGPIPKATDTVKADYIGTLIDGHEFDNSYKHGEPIEIPVTGVIKGWVEALQLMTVGSKWKLFIPSDLAYGDRGAGGAIPGGAALIFTIELKEIVNH